MQTDTSVNNKRIAKNTLLLYFRMLIMMFVTLYTSRIVLHMLGVEDYGIYNVVGGIVSMLGFLNSSMAIAVQRFLSYEMGKGENGRIKYVFSIAMLAHIAIAIFVIIILETIGLWYLNNKMVIPIERLDAANWVLQCSIITTFFSIMQVPYNGIIIAKEDMGIYAYISIIEAALKLLIAYLLLIGDFDRLKLYAILMMIVTLITLTINRVYCIRKYPEARFKFTKDSKLLKEIVSFAGWNMVGEVSWVLTGQGVNIILNYFFGPAVNAARGLAEQVNAAVMRFISNFQTALNPQLIKSFSAGQIEEMKKLLFTGSRLSYFILFFLALPILMEMDFILGLWLKEVPMYTTIFCQLIIICSLVACISNLLAQVARAYGEIRKYQFVVSLFLMLNFPLSFVILKLGASPEMTIVINISIQATLLFVRLYLIRQMIPLSIREFCGSVVEPIILVSFIAAIAPYLWKWITHPSILNSISTILIALVSAGVTILFIGLTNGERNNVFKLIKRIIK